MVQEGDQKDLLLSDICSPSRCAGCLSFTFKNMVILHLHCEMAVDYIQVNITLLHSKNWSSSVTYCTQQVAVRARLGHVFTCCNYFWSHDAACPDKMTLIVRIT
jgi:hypothetical protein